MAEAEIVEPLSVDAVRDLRFGSIAVAPMQSGSVTVPADSGPASFAGGASAACSGIDACSAGPALFTVTGERGRDYAVSLPSEVTAEARDTAGPPLQVTQLSVRSRNRPDGGSEGRLDDSGMDEVSVGGTLAIPAGTAPGNYAAEVAIVVSYS